MFKPDEQSIERMKICLKCEYFFKPSRQCMKCGCFMPLKVRIRNQECPIGKWKDLDKTE